MHVYRIQPQNAELHAIQSVTSNDETLPGVFVFESLEEAYGCREWRLSTPDVELATIACDERDLRHAGDYEGVLLLAGCGEIIERRQFGSVGDCAEWLGEQIA